MNLPAYRRYAFVLAVTACLLPPSMRSQTPVKTFVVNTTLDAVDASPGDGKCTTNLSTDPTKPVCTLRAAIDEANALSSTNSSSFYAITLPAGTYSFTVKEVCKDTYSNPSVLTLCFTGNIILNGADPATTILDGGAKDRVVMINPTSVTTINKVTIQNGIPSASLCCYVPDDHGSGIDNQGSLSVINSIVTHNSSNGIYTAGKSLTVEGTTFSANQDSAIVMAGPVSVDLSTFTNNIGSSAAIRSPGGSYNYRPKLTLSNSTLTGNTSTQGTTIYLVDDSTIVNTTISANSATGGAIQANGNLILNNDTIYGNTGDNYGRAISASQNYPTIIKNSILYNNGGYLECNGGTDGGYNLFDGQCSVTTSTSRKGVDPQLGLLALDGGTLAVMRPIPGSPAIGKGSSATPGSNAAGACTALDENGASRGSACSIGASEPLAGLQILNVNPKAGGIGGSVTVNVHGSGFVTGSTFVLKQGSTTLTPSQVTLTADTLSVTGVFDLTTAAAGAYDIVVTTPTSSVKALGGFTVQPNAAPAVSAYLAGASAVRVGQTAYFTVNYANTGNVDAYLVPIFLQTPGNYAGLAQSPVPAPPSNSQQIITDFSVIPIDVIPESGGTNAEVPLLIPVIPAGSQGTFSFSVAPPANAAHGSKFTVDANIGSPLGQGSTGTVSATVLTNLVAAGQSVAQSKYNVTLSSQDLAAMKSYAATQLANEVAAGEQALLSSASAKPIFFSTAQLTTDIAAFGASLEGYKAQIRFDPEKLRPYAGSGGGGGGEPICSGVPLPPGTSCKDDHHPFPSNNPLVNCNYIVNLLYDGGNPPSCPPPKPSACPDPNGCGGPLISSLDPNEKDGPFGVGSGHYTLANSSFAYSIEFENSATATASAQDVTVTDPLDTSKYDLSTFQLGAISFGPFTLNPAAGSTSFSQALDLRPDDNVIVNVTAGLDTTTGIAKWTFTSLDPATMQATTDALAGFLPPDTAPPAGIGHVTYSIQPLATVADAAQICNTASIVFDTNAAISTNTFCNTKDITPPASMVQALAATQNNLSFPVTWSGTDSGSGVGTYTIYVSDNGGGFTAWQTATTSTSAQYTGVDGHTYSFYSIATDLVGNVEAAKVAGEASTMLVVAPAANLNPTSIAFGSVAVGSSSSAMVTVTSTGGTPLTVTGFTLSDTVNFSQSNTCSSALSAGQSCTVTVVFSPTASASTNSVTNATLSLVSNAGTAPSPVALTGTAFSPAPYIFVVNAAGSVSSLYSNGSAQSSAIAGGGIGAAVDRNGLMFSLTADGTGVSIFNDDGTLVNTTSGVLTGASALAIDGGDQLWIAAPGSVSMGQILGSGQASIGDPTLLKPSGVAIDISGNVWIADSQSNTVHEIVGGGLPAQPLANAVSSKTPGTEPQ
jgi:CSLREA domain-containing protein